MTTEKCEWCGEGPDSGNNFFGEDIMPNRVFFDIDVIHDGDGSTNAGRCCNECLALWLLEAPEDFKLISIRKYEVEK